MVRLPSLNPLVPTDVKKNKYRLMLHDPELYSDPYEFRPERFLPTDENGKPQKVPMDPKKIAFGFGRR